MKNNPKMALYRLSQFSHMFSKNNRMMLYHSLFMKYVFVDGCIVSTEKRTIEVTDEFQYRQLQQNGIIVDSIEDDNKLLQRYRDEIKEPYISTAYFFITKNCNLACRYCFERQSEVSNSKDGIMSIPIFEKGLDFFVRLIKLDMSRYNERKTLIFYGGEPFQNKEVLYCAISKVNEYIAKKKLPAQTKMIIVTNGTLLNDEDILFCKNNDVTITFSLDGDKAASVNRVFPDMKTLAWEKATETYLKCKAANIDLNVACTLTPQTIERQKEVLSYFINVAQITNIGFNVILDNDIIQLDNNYDDAAAEFVSSSYRVLSNSGITENRTRRRIEVYDRKQPCIFDCNAAGGRQIAIAPNGDVGICHEHIMDKKHFITTIDDDTFEPNESVVYKEWRKRSPLYMKECYNCPALGICGGGCVINAERKYGTIHRSDMRFCKQTLRILENILL